MQVAEAGQDELELVCRFYEEVCLAQAGDAYGPDWHYGVYPAREDLEERIARNELYLFRHEGVLRAAMVIARQEDELYRDVPWKVREEPIHVLHLFAVHPSYRGSGLGRAALLYMLGDAREKGAKAVHLDVVKGNLPAERLYRSVGFRFVEERGVWYPDTGACTVCLYEFCLKRASETA